MTVILEHFLRGVCWRNTLLYTALIAVAAALIIWSHRENLGRLKAGTERKIGRKTAS